MSKKEQTLKMLTRVAALIGAVLLFGLYVSTLIAALSDSPHFERLFMGSIATTFFIPTLIYVLKWLSRLFGNKN